MDFRGAEMQAAEAKDRLAEKNVEIRRLTMALENVALLDEADGHELTAAHAHEAVAIATATLGKHPSQIHAERYGARRS